MKNKILASFVALLFATQAHAQAVCNDTIDGYTLDWNNYSWTGSGTTTNNFVVTRPDGSDPVTVTMSFAGATGFFFAGNGGFPQVSNLITGGYGATENTLGYIVDFDNTSRLLTLNVTFSEQVYNTVIPMVDVDFLAPTGGTGGFQDQVRIDGQNLPVSTTRFRPESETPYHALPTTTQAPSTVQLFSANTGRSRGLTGNALPDEDLGNVTSTFSDILTNVRIRYNNNQIVTSDPDIQGVAIHDITFCVPRFADIEATKDVIIFNQSGVGCGVIPGTPEAGLPAALPGACIEYEINVSNIGEASATGLDVVDILDSNLVFQAVDVSGFITTEPGYAIVSPSAGTLCSGSSCTVGIENGRLDEGDSGTIIIRATVQ